MKTIIDPRHITNGREIPSYFYADQPYVVRTDDGAWLSVMTTGEGREGSNGQFVKTQRSVDLGKTWTDEARMEAPGAPENSWGVLLKAPSGRIFCFYVFNEENLRKILADPGSPQYPDGYCYRVDSIGSYVFRYSDDHGKRWSDERYTIPVREFDIDRRNTHKGAVRFFWNVGKPFAHDRRAYVPLHKVGGFGGGFFTSTVGALVVSSNLFAVDDPANASWVTLPEGDAGICAPEKHGPIAEEHSFVVLSDESFFTVYRTISGYAACAYSRDKGLTWSRPARMQFADGRAMKNPRAANFVWKCANGKYLYWFHNHGGPHVLEMHKRDALFPYSDRNPVWFSGGVEADSPDGKIILWSEPEIVLYDDDPLIRMSYPDLIEQDGKLYVSETQKDVARIHELDLDTINGLWGQFDDGAGQPPVPLFTLSGPDDLKKDAMLPQLPPFTERDPERRDYGTRDLRRGFTLDLAIVRGDGNTADNAVFDNRDRSGRGLALYHFKVGFVFIMSNGQYTAEAPIYPPDAAVHGKFRLTILIDGGPKIISTCVTGSLPTAAKNINSDGRDTAST